MPLTAGVRLGPYEIVGELGAGGMGEVYRARDARLQRDVAIKTLPATFARDPERLARFEREARTLAALNHPHIAHVYGVIDVPADAGGHALVMEFVDGEDLARRIARGRMPTDDVVPIALQIAEGLEAAHEMGIVHRDLKPANIKVRPDGQVKILDFGLAKALAPPDAVSAPSLEDSPTVTSPSPLSQSGVILGTAAYMAPEQLKGKPLDKRADIWAFGCVLYEMLAGRRVFGGEDVADTLAAIVRADPDWSRLPPDTPPGLRTLLRRCLEKDRRERLPDIAAARLELKDAAHAGGAAAAAASPPQPRRAMLPWAIAALGTAVAFLSGATLLVHDARQLPGETGVYKASIVLPAPLSGAPALRLQLSPDGRRLAFIAPDQSGHPALWIRPLDGTVGSPVAGTLDASAPFWSPDSRWVGFIADGKLKKVDLSTGAVISLCDTAVGPPGTWSGDDILFTRGSTIARVSASGGQPANVTTLAPDESRHISPFFLPDGRQFLYTVSAAGSNRPGVYLGSIESRGGSRLIDSASNAAYANGYLLFIRDTTLMARRFDPRTHTFAGVAAPVAEGIQVNPLTGTGAFSVSTTGVLVYQTGSTGGTVLRWFDRAGKALGTIGSGGDYQDVELSPDGKFASITIRTGGAQGDVWLFDIARNLSRRVTLGGSTVGAVWSPDGRYLVYGTRRSANGASRDLYRRAASGSDAEELILHDDREKIPLGFSADGQTLLYRIPAGVGSGELWLLPLNGEATPRAFSPGKLQTPAAVSPDGRWLAYVSDESGRREVYVTSFPDGVGRWQLSEAGGDNPRWRADGRELYYATLDDTITAVDVVATGTHFEPGAARALFTTRLPAATFGSRSTYATTRDGQRFLVNTWDTGASVTPITLVLNWPASLK